MLAAAIASDLDSPFVSNFVLSGKGNADNA